MSNPNPQPASPTRSPLVIIIVALIALLLAASAFFIGRMSATPKANPAGPSNVATVTASPNTTPPPADPKAKEQQDKALEAIRAQPKRQADDPFAQGKVDAPVVLVEFSDFSCPFCAQFANSTKPALKKLIDDGTLRIEWRDTAIFPEGKLTAAAARVAAEQGKFWEFHEIVFAAHSGSGHPKYSADQYVEMARKAGVPNLKKFRADLADPKFEKQVTEQTETVIKSLGIQSTPAFLINDQAIVGAQPVQKFQEVIAQELAKAKAK